MILLVTTDPSPEPTFCTTPQPLTVMTLVHPQMAQRLRVPSTHIQMIVPLRAAVGTPTLLVIWYAVAKPAGHGVAHWQPALVCTLFVLIHLPPPSSWGGGRWGGCRSRHGRCHRGCHCGWHTIGHTSFLEMRTLCCGVLHLWSTSGGYVPNICLENIVGFAFLG